MYQPTLSRAIPTDFVRSPCKDCKTQVMLEILEGGDEGNVLAQECLRKAKCTNCVSRIQYSDLVEEYGKATQSKYEDISDLEDLKAIIDKFFEKLGITDSHAFRSLKESEIIAILRGEWHGVQFQDRRAVRTFDEGGPR